MAAQTGSPRHVALIVETSNAYARGLLSGIHRYISENPGWSIYIGEHSRQDTDLSWLEGWQGDGAIARIENEETARQVRALGVPAVDLSAARLAPEFPCVETDDAAIAAIAVRHFSERGLRHFAFLGDPRFAWSVKRAAGFRRHVAEAGSVAHEFELAPGSAGEKRRSLVNWLTALPKPIGILACYDIAGQELLEACKIAGIRVPDEVAVLGVDNDELICTLTSPPMSSIQSDALSTGHLAASILDRMMTGDPWMPGLHLLPPLRVAARQSSDLVSVDDPVVARAVAFIRDSAGRKVSVPEVLRHAGMSRRALDYRFTHLLGRTVHDEIMRVRMERVAHLLISTDWTLPRIAEFLEFPHSEYMGVAFRRFTGTSPGQYRKANRPG
ncbi:MAG TPA: DNA-binding transcriptional regulator [Pseudolysinimonas sp.]|jgi:LacI family transcriptional regulator|nr:DNA-binding transcriptional regulator [Pseudolysinimonas sp.]